jgi:hypothetical protein
MKTAFAVSLAAVTLSLALASPVHAWGLGHHRHGLHGHGLHRHGLHGHGLHRHGLHGPRRHHGFRSHLFLGIRPFHGGHGRYPAYSPPRVVVREPRVFVERRAARSYWHYCGSAGAYYPDVQTCPEPWIRVPPRSD